MKDLLNLFNQQRPALDFDAIKIALAMNRHAGHAKYVTIEEPENHLSHTSLVS